MKNLIYSLFFSIVITLSCMEKKDKDMVVIVQNEGPRKIWARVSSPKKNRRKQPAKADEAEAIGVKQALSFLLERNDSSAIVRVSQRKGDPFPISYFIDRDELRGWFEDLTMVRLTLRGDSMSCKKVAYKELLKK